MHSPARLDSVFTALADPMRRRILELLARAERPVTALVAEFRISQPAVTKHLHVLERARLISRRKAGRQRLCRLRPEALAPSLDWIRRCQAFWNQRLDALEQLIAILPKESPHDRR